MKYRFVQDDDNHWFIIKANDYRIWNSLLTSITIHPELTELYDELEDLIIQKVSNPSYYTFENWNFDD